MNRPTLMQHINRRLDAHRNGEAGLALLDVLLGMAIFALIAVIAVQSMGLFRDRAYMTQVASDVGQLATGVSGYLTEPGASIDLVPTGKLDAATLEGFGVNLTGGAEAFVERSSTVEGLDLCVQNETSFAVWRADRGSLSETGDVSGVETCTVQLGAASPEDGDEGPAEEPVGNNDFLVDAHPIVMAADDYGTFLTSNYDNTDATKESGELDNRTLWWKFVAPRDGVYTFQVVQPAPLDPKTSISIATSIRVYRAAGSGPGTPVGVAVSAGETLNIMVGSYNSSSAQFRVAAHSAPSNDAFSNAIAIDLAPGQEWISDVVTNSYSVVAPEPGEPSGRSRASMWWRFTAPKAGNYKVSQLAAPGKTLRVETEMWRSNATNISDLASTPMLPDGTLHLEAGEEVVIRAGLMPGATSHHGAYRVRVIAPL